MIELSSNLDYAQGGDVAVNLDRLYNYVSSRLGEGMCTFSTQSVDEAIRLTQSLREAWIGLDQQSSRQQQSPQRLRAYVG